MAKVFGQQITCTLKIYYLNAIILQAENKMQHLRNSFVANSPSLFKRRVILTAVTYIWSDYSLPQYAQLTKP